MTKTSENDERLLEVFAPAEEIAALISGSDFGRLRRSSGIPVQLPGSWWRE
jgi:hypothetical protein